ncbi:MAG: metallophosphoesterase [Clostridia bacterium]|nr:metallophosphoesterase [Clostridia bacterium]
MTEIEKLNPQVRELLTQARRPVNRGPAAYLNELPVLTLMHITDPHGAAEELRRVVLYAGDMAGLFEDVLCTGDMVSRYFHRGYAFWHEAGCDPFLVCVGNHDALNDHDYNWDDRVPQKTLAATFFEPYVDKWGGVEYTPGTTYFCKRYPAHKIDLVTVNTMLEDEDDPAQLAFVREKLDRARAEGCAVVIGTHDTAATEQTVVPSRFSCLDRPVEPPCGPGLRRHYQEAVDAFMNAGGEFICYLGGHGHRDYICFDPAFPRQFFFLGPAVDMWKGDRHGDADRKAGEKSQDAFNFVSFERASGTVKLIRVGADRDHFLRHRGVLCFDYKNGKILYED